MRPNQICEERTRLINRLPGVEHRGGYYPHDAGFEKSWLLKKKEHLDKGVGLKAYWACPE